MEAKQFLLRDIQLYLEKKLIQILPNTIECSLSNWLYPDGKLNIQLPAEFSIFDYSHVAQLSFITVSNSNLLNEKESLLIEGLERLMGRPASNNSFVPSTFHNDAISLLGLALGADLVGNKTRLDFYNWLKSFVNLSNDNLPEWKKILLHAALWITNKETKIDAHYSSDNLDLLFALRSKGFECFQEIDINEVYASICRLSVYEETNTIQIIARLQAINYYLFHSTFFSLANPNLNQLITLLNNLPGSFKRWIWEEKAKTTTGTPQKWDIQNEYHVQSLLYYILAPIFPDIESEFYLEPVGSLNSRADIGLPGLNLIIEVKFLRKTKKFHDMIEEVAADNSLYFKRDSVFKKKYSRMLVFLWDDSGRIEEHQTFKNAVDGLENIIGSIVIPRPGMMI